MSPLSVNNFSKDIIHTRGMIIRRLEEVKNRRKKLEFPEKPQHLHPCIKKVVSNLKDF